MFTSVPFAMFRYNYVMLLNKEENNRQTLHHNFHILFDNFYITYFVLFKKII